MSPIFSFLISPGSKKKEPRYECLSETRASHAHKTSTEVSSSVSHFQQMELLLSSVTCKRPLRVLCPVRRPITTLNCVLLKDNYRALVAKLSPEISSWTCLCVLQGLHHITKCWLSIQRFIFFSYILPRDPQGQFRSNILLKSTVCCLLELYIASSKTTLRGWLMHVQKTNCTVLQDASIISVTPLQSSTTRRLVRVEWYDEMRVCCRHLSTAVCTVPNAWRGHVTKLRLWRWVCYTDKETLEC